MMELDNCPCSGANLPRFVQPVILAVLSSGPLHGYLVVQRLAETSLFRKQPPDATGVYRMLRNMEQEGVLESDWELENSGPARKRYTLTEKGGHCLDQWMRTLTSHQAFIANLLLFLQDARSGMNSEPCPMPEHSVSLYPQEVFLSAGSPFPPASCGCGTPQPFAGAVHMNTYSSLTRSKIGHCAVCLFRGMRCCACWPLRRIRKKRPTLGVRPGISRILWSATKGGCGAPSASIAAPAR